jgi:nitrogen regulatory protein PII
LHPGKLITVITSDVLESRLVQAVTKRGATGYTVFRAHGAGTSGEQSGMLDVDTNIVFHVVVPTEKVSAMLDALEAMGSKGHHLTVLVSDVGMLWPEKYQ